MKKFVGGIVLSSLTVAAVLSQNGFAQNTNVSEAEAKMFAASAGYERFMGRWSRLLAPAYITFAGVKNGDRVRDVGTGTGSLAAAVEASMPASEIVGVDPSEGFIAYAQKNAKSARVHFEVGDAQALKFGIVRQHFGVARHEFCPRSQQGERRNAPCDPCARHRQCLHLGLRRRHANAQVLLGRSHCARSGDRAQGRASHEALPPGSVGRALEEGWRLINVKEEPLVIDQAYSSFNDYWEPFTKGAGPGGAYVVSLSEDRRQQLEISHAQALA